MKRLLICMLLILGTYTVHAQYYQTDTATRKGFDRSRLVLGGSLGFVIGDYTNVNLSPLVGYRFNDFFAAGVNVNAQYGSWRQRDGSNRTAQRNKYTIFGGGVWARAYPFQQFFIHVQPEYNWVSQKNTYYSDPKRTESLNYGVPSLLIGGGYSQPVGGRAAISIMLLYDVLQDDRSPYQNGLIYRGGVNIGF